MADSVDRDAQLRIAALGRQSTNSFIYTDDKQPQVDNDASVMRRDDCQAIVLAAQIPPRGMISPLRLWRVWWELFIHFLILFQSIVVPFELAFLVEYLMVNHTSWYLVEVFMMLVFLADMVMVFRTGFLSHGKIDYDARHVAWNYLTTWFVIDFVAWLPCVLAVIMTPLETDPEESRSAAVARLGRSLKFARVVRILRVLQIARVARLRHLVRGLQLQVLHSETVSRIVEHVGIAMAVFLLLHLVACIWGAVAPLDYHLEQQGLGEDASIESRYLLAMWWASCALSFGGHPAPHSDGERVLMVFVNLANVAAICGVVAWCAGFFSRRDNEDKALMDKVRVASRFASDNGLPKSLTMEMKRAIQHAQHSKQSARDFKDMVEGDLSQDLCQRVYGWVHGNLLRRFPPFSNEAGKLFLGCTEEVPDRFLSQLAYEAKITTFMAGDRVATAGDKAETMAFVLEGSLLLLSPSSSRSHVLREKYWFGEPVLIFKHVRRNSRDNFRWTSKSSTRSATIVALENCKLLEIGQDSFNFAVKQHNLLNSWLRPVVDHMESGRGTLGCSCCGQLDHWVLQCSESHGSPLERLHVARSEANYIMGHPPRPKWLPTTGPGNLSVPPEMWGMRLRQWAAFIVACCFTEKWAELEESTDRKEAGHVNLYQVCENMVKPWTKGTGNSVALLMNNEQPLKAEVMISHAWGESVLETLTAVLGKASVTGITLDTTIWFCTFAQYQPGDQPGDCGPTVAQQLALDPFKRVIESRPRYGMLVVHTSTAELYNRLWCVFEVNEAKASDVRPISAYSMGALKQLQDLGADGNNLEAALRVDTSKALCWSESDKAMIHSKILSDGGGGFKQLDEKILNFRRASVTVFRAMFKKFADWAGSGDQEKSTFEGLTKVVDQAGVFVGLHCLAPYIEASHDSELAVKMMARAKEICELLTSNFSESALPPPCIDPAKMQHQVDAGDDDQVQACLLDLAKFPFPTGLLEMAAGGCLPALLAREAGLPSRDGASTPTLQQAFQRWTGGSAKMRRNDLIKLLSVLGLEHLEQDIDLHFSLADTNNDGLLDFLEFSSWVLDPSL